MRRGKGYNCFQVQLLPGTIASSVTTKERKKDACRYFMHIYTPLCLPYSQPPLNTVMGTTSGVMKLGGKHVSVGRQ